MSHKAHVCRSLGSLRRAAPRAVRAEPGESGREGMEVSCERCAVHGAARCGWICGSRKPRRRGKGPCEGTGSGRRGARAVFVGALRLELIGPRSTARPALLRCEPPPSPGRVRGVRACKDAAARDDGVRARGGGKLQPCRGQQGACYEAVQNCNRAHLSPQSFFGPRFHLPPCAPQSRGRAGAHLQLSPSGSELCASSHVPVHRGHTLR